MADDNKVGTLVAKFVLDTSTWDATIKKAKAALSEMSSSDQQRATKSQAIADKALASVKDQTKATAQVAVEAAKAVIHETKKVDALRLQMSHLKDILSQQKAIVAESLAKAKAATVETEKLQKIVAGRAEETKQLQEQIKLISQKNKIEREPSGGGGPSGVGRVAGGAARGFLGTGLLGTVVSGFAVGAAFEGVELLTKGIEKLSEKIKEFITDSGKLQQLRGTFEGLVKGRGENPVEIVEKLREATHGLVPEIQLIRTANTFMQSSIKMSTEDMIKLTQATVGLARAQGNDAVAALNALNRSFLTNQARVLSHVTGIQRTELQTRNYGQALSLVDRQNQQFLHTTEVIIKRYHDLGEPALTYTERIKQLDVAQKEFFENVARATVTSGGFGMFISLLGQAIEKFGSLQSAAQAFGETISGIFGVASTVVSSFLEVASSITGSTKDTYAAGKAYIANGDESTSVTDEFVRRLTTINGIFETLAGVVIGIKYEFLEAANGVRLFGRILGHAVGLDSIGEAKPMAPWEVTKKFPDAASQTKYYTDFAAAHPSTKLSPYEEFKRNDAALEANQLQDLQDLHEKFNPNASAAAQAREVRIKHQQEENVRNARQLASSALKTQEKEAQASLAAAKLRISEEKDANEDLYQSGGESMKKYYFDKKNLVEETYKVTQDEINSEIDLKLKAEKQKLARKDITPAVFDENVAGLEADRGKRLSTALKTYLHENNSIKLKENRETIQARIQLIELELKNSKFALDEQVTDTKAAFKDQTISAADYLQTRIQQIQAEVALVTDAKDKEIALSKDAPREAIKYYNEKLAAIRLGLKALNQELNTGLQESLQDVQKRFGNQTSALQSLAGIASTPGGANLLGRSEVDIKQQTISVISAQISALNNLVAAAKPYSDTWFKIYEDILKATEQQQQMILQVQLLKSTAYNVSGAFESIANAASKIVTGASGRNVIESLSGGFKQIQDSIKFTQTVLGTAGAVLTPEQLAAKTAAKALADASTQSSSGLDAFTSSIQTAKDRLNASFDAIKVKVDALSSAFGDLIQNITGQSSDGAGGSEGGGATPGDFPDTPTASVGNSISTSGSSSSSSGGIGGILSKVKGGLKKLGGGSITQGIIGSVNMLAGAVGTIAGAKSPISGALGGGLAMAGTGAAFGAIFGGPLGAAVGAAVGAVVGAIGGIISGGKAQRMQHQIQSLELAYIKMSESFAAGTTSLTGTIAQLQSLIAIAQAEKASSKKDGGQYQQLITQYNQQLASLQAQQAKTLLSLKEQLSILSTPQPYQDTLSSIQSILDKYKEFASAASSATDLANANKFLVQSLQGQGLDIGNEILDGEKKAIQNALDLNDLYLQRNQLQIQYLSQVQGIFAKGNITRTATKAQSGFSELFQAQQSYAQQLDKINQQIALSQYQLTVEQQVFDLATTKAGLERQLLTLQEYGVNQDMARIVALQNVLDKLEKSGYSITNLGGLNVGDPNSVVIQLLQSLVSALGVSGGSSGILAGLVNLLGGGASATPSAISADSIFSAAFKSRAQFGYGAFRNLDTVGV